MNSFFYNTVIELPEFQKTISKILTEVEKEDLIDYLAINPKSGNVIPGTGGIRKLRWSRKGMGKRGGTRVIYYYYNENIPLFLLTAFSKSEKTNISKEESKKLANFVNELLDDYQR